MDEQRKISLDLSEWLSIKEKFFKRPYVDRISIGMTIRMIGLYQTRKRDLSFIEEIDFLEGISHRTMTKPATKFKYPPLSDLWHKHFYSPQNLLENVGAYWNAGKGGNKKLDNLINDVAKNHGHDPDKWPGILAHCFFIEGYEERMRHGATGDWIIFAKHNGQNYYLDVASHSEGSDASRLYEKLRSGSEAEFPFVFSAQ